MYISEFVLTDLKNFQGEHRISLDRGAGRYAGWSVLAGRNGSGKTTLLRALAATIVGPRAAVQLVDGFGNWVRQGGTLASVAVKLTVDPKHDRSINKGKTRAAPFWLGMKWTNAYGVEGYPVWDETLGSKTSAWVERGPWADGASGWFVAGYGAYRHLAPPSISAVKKAANPTLARLINLFDPSASLSEAVDWLQAVQLRVHENREGAKELRDAVLNLLSDGLLPDGTVADRVDSEGLWINRDGVSLLVHQVSDGYQSVATLVVDIARRIHDSLGGFHAESTGDVAVGKRWKCTVPGVVLIDELDSHMHVSWQQRIGFWLVDHFPNIQFIVSTHSPFICQAASRRGVLRLPAPGEDRRIEHINERLFNNVINGGADDAVLSELFGLDHSHSFAAEQRRQQLAELERQAITKNGKLTPEQKTNFERLRAQMPSGIGEDADRKYRAYVAATGVR